MSRMSLQKDIAQNLSFENHQFQNLVFLHISFCQAVENDLKSTYVQSVLRYMNYMRRDSVGKFWDWGILKLNILEISFCHTIPVHHAITFRYLSLCLTERVASRFHYEGGGG